MSHSRRAADAYRRGAGFIKETGGSERTPVPPAPHGPQSRPPAKTPGSVRKAAVFLSLIGRAEAANILKQMPQEQIDPILATMAGLGEVGRIEARQVLTEFGGAPPAGRIDVRPGPETAREMLVRAFGVEDGDRRFYEILPEQRPRRFAFLDDIDGKQLAGVLRRESVATIAILCSAMPGIGAARLLEALAPDIRAQVVRRVAHMGRVEPTALDAIEQSLRHRLETIELGEAEIEVEGHDRLAEILRYMDVGAGERIVGDLQASSPELAEQVKQRLTTLDDVAALDRRDLQKLLQHVEDVDLAVVIKGRPAEFADLLLSGVSERRRQLIDQEREALGPMRRSDIDRTASDLVELCRKMAEQGEVTIRLPGDEIVDGGPR